MNVTKKRDIEKTYALPEFIAKLRRLADALESGARFDIQVAGERVGSGGRQLQHRARAQRQ